MDREIGIDCVGFLILNTGDCAHVERPCFGSVIGRDVGSEAEQIMLAGGYDQTWILSKGEGGLTHAATV